MPFATVLPMYTGFGYLERLVHHKNCMEVVQIVGPWGSCVCDEHGDELVVFVPMEKH